MLIVNTVNILHYLHSKVNYIATILKKEYTNSILQGDV